VKLHHTDDGPRDAPVLLLAGSLGSTLAMWEPQLTLAGPFRVIRVDHRGHGGSPTPPGPYAMPDLAADFVELLDDLELAEVAFCGLSLGGMIGMYLGSEHPHRLSSLTLCCTTAHFADKTPWDQRIAAVEADGTAGIADTVPSPRPSTRTRSRWSRASPARGWRCCPEPTWPRSRAPRRPAG